MANIAQVKTIYIYKWKFTFDNYAYRANVHCRINGEDMYVPVSGLFQPINTQNFDFPRQFKYSATIVSPEWGEKLYYFDYSQALYNNYLNNIDWDYKVVLSSDETQVKPDRRWENPLQANETGLDKTMPLDESQTVHRPLIAILKLIRDKKVQTVNTYNELTAKNQWEPKILAKTLPEVFVRT